MRVSEAMTNEVAMVRPDQTMREAARLMADADIGALPVNDGDKLVGMVTDRDIAIRGVGAGKSADTPVSEIMSREVLYCFEDEELDNVAANMSDVQVRRLPVLDRRKRLVGIVSLGDLAMQDDTDCATTAITGVSEPSDLHSQRLDGAGASSGRQAGAA